jgi:hypothetical protein
MHGVASILQMLPGSRPGRAVAQVFPGGKEVVALTLMPIVRGALAVSLWAALAAGCVAGEPDQAPAAEPPERPAEAAQADSEAPLCLSDASCRLAVCDLSDAVCFTLGPPWPGEPKDKLCFGHCRKSGRPAPEKGPACGEGSCPVGQTCCNPSCGLCVPPGGVCIEKFCGLRQPPPGEACGNHVCGAGTYCCNPSCGICAPLGGVCTQQFCQTPR